MKLLSALLVILLTGDNNNKKEFDLVISNPRIINVEDGSIIMNHDILIKGNMIVGIVPHKAKYHKSATVVDAKNNYAIPGLWDMHVHALDYFDYSNLLMLANGITGFRDLWGNLLFADTVRMKMQRGEVPFQRFIVAGNLIDGAVKTWPGSQEAATPERGVELVDSLYKAGAGFIKVYSRLTPETFTAIAKRCKELNIKFAGHVPDKVKLINASNAGMYSMEHLHGFAAAFSDIEDSIFAVLDKINYTDGDATVRAALVAELQGMRMRSKIVPEKVKKVVDVLKANNTWVVPTLLSGSRSSYMDVLDAGKDNRLSYLPLWLTNSWKESNDLRVRNWKPQQWADAKTSYQKRIVYLGLLNRNKVLILAGTDLPNPYCIPGFGLHDEFELMNGAGLNPLEVLQSATLNPAKYLNKTDSLGTISVNKYADILLLSENPLENISNTRKIEGLVMNGKWYNKQDLETLKQKAKEYSVEEN